MRSATSRDAGTAPARPSRMGRFVLVFVLFFVQLLSLAAAPAAAATDQALLAAADLFSQAPAAFRAELTVGADGSTAQRRMAIYRRGGELAVIRLLDPKDRG